MQKGFTLVEIMIVIVITLTAGLLIFGLLSDGIGLFREGEENISANSQFKVIKRYLGRDIKMAENISEDNNGRELELDTNQGTIEYKYVATENHLIRSDGEDKILMENIREVHNSDGSTEEIFVLGEDNGNLTGWVTINLEVINTETELIFSSQSKYFQE
ncbi:MAG: PilW family protein [Bacillota bacterium]